MEMIESTGEGHLEFSLVNELVATDNMRRGSAADQHMAIQSISASQNGHAVVCLIGNDFRSLSNAHASIVVQHKNALILGWVQPKVMTLW